MKSKQREYFATSAGLWGGGRNGKLYLDVLEARVYKNREEMGKINKGKYKQRETERILKCRNFWKD